MKIERFQYFTEVAKAGSITAAAKKCYISQTAMSQQMDSLEKDLGVRLLLRTKTGTSLTPAGKELLPKAEKLLAVYKEIQDTFAMGNAGGRKLTVSYTGPMEQHLLLAAVPRFHKLHPAVNVQLRQCAMSQAGEELENDICDIVLTVAGEIGLKNGFHIPILEKEMCVSVSSLSPLAQESSLSLAQLKSYPVIILRPDASAHVSRDIRSWLLSMGWPEKQIRYADNIESQLLMVSLNEGISLMPEGIYPKGIRLIPLKAPDRLIHHTEAVLKKKSRLCSDMIALLCQEADRNPSGLPGTEEKVMR